MRLRWHIRLHEGMAVFVTGMDHREGSGSLPPSQTPPLPHEALLPVSPIALFYFYFIIIFRMKLSIGVPLLWDTELTVTLQAMYY